MTDTPARRRTDQPPIGVGGRVAVVWTAALAIWVAVGWLGAAWFGAAYSLPRHAVMAALTTGLTVPTVLAVVRWLDRREPIATLLGPTRRVVPALLLGAGAYLLPAAAAMGLLVWRGGVRLQLRTDVGDLVLLVAGLVVLVACYEALPEELVFRGYVQGHLEAVLPPWRATLVQAALFTAFGAAIGAAGSLERLVVLAIVGLALGLIRSATGTVWAAVGFHTAFQTVQQALGTTHHRVNVSDRELVELIGLGLVPLVGGVLLATAGASRRSRLARSTAGPFAG